MRETKTVKELYSELMSNNGPDSGFVSNDAPNIIEKVESIENSQEGFINKSYLADKPNLGKVLPPSSFLHIEECIIDDSDIRSTRKAKSREITKTNILLIPLHAFINNSFLGKIRHKYLQWRKNASK